MEFNEELKKQAKEIFSLYAKHSPSGYAITEEDFIWTLAEYDSRQSKVSRVELPVKPENTAKDFLDNKLTHKYLQDRWGVDDKTAGYLGTVLHYVRKLTREHFNILIEE